MVSAYPSTFSKRDPHILFVDKVELCALLCMKLTGSGAAARERTSVQSLRTLLLRPGGVFTGLLKLPGRRLLSLRLKSGSAG